MGIKFQTEPNGPYSMISTHLRFHEIDARSQQESVGVVGVNLIYGAFYQHDRPRKMLRYLFDHIDKSAIEIDTINFTGPLFEDVDNRILSLELVKNGMTEAVMFGPDGNNLLPARVLYKKTSSPFVEVFACDQCEYGYVYKLILSVLSRRRRRKTTPWTSLKSPCQICGQMVPVLSTSKTLWIVQTVVRHGLTVMISNFKEYYRLVEYFQTTPQKIRLSMG